jgi:hypothetical protein
MGEGSVWLCLLIAGNVTCHVGVERKYKIEENWYNPSQIGRTVLLSNSFKVLVMTCKIYG